MTAGPIYLRGHALWTPGFNSLAALLAGEENTELKRPPIALVESRMKRATSLMTRMAVECVAGALTDANIPLSEAATLFGSTHGEIQIAVDQMVMMRDGEGQISPARFKNSVHNTAAGLFSIAAKNRGFTTAIAAGADTFAMTLLEGLALLQTGEAHHAVVSICDEALPDPIHPYAPHGPAAIALALSTEGEAGTHLTLSLEAQSEPVLSPGPVHPRFEGHSAAGAFRLLLAAKERRVGEVALDDRWKVHLR